MAVDRRGIDRRGILNTSAGVQALGEMLKSYYAFRELFPDSPNLKSPRGKLKNLLTIIEQKSKNREEITLEELVDHELLSVVQAFFGQKTKKLSYNEQKRFLERLKDARLYASLDRTIRDEIDRTAIPPSELKITPTQAKKLNKYFGIVDADIKGLTIDEIYQLQDALNMSDQIKNLCKNPQQFYTLIDQFKSQLSNKTIGELNRLIDGLDPRILGELLKENGLPFKNDDRLTAEEIEQLEEALRKHLQLQKIGLNVAKVKRKLNYAIYAYENFVNSSRGRKFIEDKFSIPREAIDGLHYLAKLHQLLTNDKLEEGLEQFKTMLANYSTRPEIKELLEARYGITSQEAADAIRGMIEQYEQTKPVLEKIASEGNLDQLINVTADPRAKRDGLSLNQLQKLGIVDPFVIRAIRDNSKALTEHKKTAEKENALTEVKDLAQGAEDARSIYNDPTKFAKTNPDLGAQINDLEQTIANIAESLGSGSAPTASATPTAPTTTPTAPTKTPWRSRLAKSLAAYIWAQDVIGVINYNLKHLPAGSDERYLRRIIETLQNDYGLTTKKGKTMDFSQPVSLKQMQRHLRKIIKTASKKDEIERSGIYNTFQREFVRASGI